MPVDFTQRSPRNLPFQTVRVLVANGVCFQALDLTEEERGKCTGALYLHVHRESRRCYVGITIQETAARWFGGIAYKRNRRFGAALRKYGWESFDTYILALFDDRESMNAAEVEAIAAAGGHKSPFTFNLSPGGDLVADNDKPLIGTELSSGKTVRFKSGSDAARKLGLNADMPTAVARGERKSAAGWWFRFEGEDRQPPKIWGEALRVEAVRAIQAKRVIALNLDTGEELPFETLNAAAAALGIEQSQVSAVASGRNLSARGWWFRFEGEARQPPRIYGQRAGRLLLDKTVYAVSRLSGQRMEFRNCTVADQELQLHRGAAAAVASGDRASAGDWWFSYDANAEAPMDFGAVLVAKARSKPIIAVDLSTGEETRFASAKDAAQALGLSRAAISHVITGKKSRARGYTFRLE